MTPKALLTGALLLGLAPLSAEAFCGFYVGGGSAKLFNNATQVVLMRDETKIVLSMQNNYQGPPEGFALVIPVPVVLKKEDVKTLPKEVFDRVEQLDAPRLVEYWERDPCDPRPYLDRESMKDFLQSGSVREESERDYGVKIEAQFSVAEYEIVVLSAKESTGLNDWLKDNKYNIPDGAEPVLKPYVSSGLKFFVAKVDPKKVTFENGQAMLSPLRFSYDSEQFFLPVRLGMLNANGAQDLIVHLLAKDRYEAANYKNVTIPTNLEVVEAVKEEFGPFYVALFDETVKKNPGAVVTEYSWQASSCDPCPIPPMSAEDLVTLGADILPNTKTFIKGEDPFGLQSYFVLTRLHARYTKDSLGEDIVFRVADPIVGGREFMGADGKLEKGAVVSTVNNFQGRYIIRHPWTGPIACQNPERGVWGGSPEERSNRPLTKPARNLAFADRSKSLSSFFPTGSTELTSYSSEPSMSMKELPKVKNRKARFCAVDMAESGIDAGFILLFGGLFAVLWVARRRR